MTVADKPVEHFKCIGIDIIAGNAVLVSLDDTRIPGQILCLHRLLQQLHINSIEPDSKRINRGQATAAIRILSEITIKRIKSDSSRAAAADLYHALGLQVSDD